MKGFKPAYEGQIFWIYSIKGQEYLTFIGNAKKNDIYEFYFLKIDKLDQTPRIFANGAPDL